MALYNKLLQKSVDSIAATFRKRDESTFSAAALQTRAWDVRKPVIAAVNGHAIGVGFTITLQCDIRIFAADAKYGIVQARRGVMGDGYSHWTLPRIAGMSGLQRIAFIAISLFSDRAFHVCADIEEAKRWLANKDAALTAAERKG